MGITKFHSRWLADIITSRVIEGPENIALFSLKFALVFVEFFGKIIGILQEMCSYGNG